MNVELLRLRAGDVDLRQESDSGLREAVDVLRSLTVQHTRVTSL